MQQKLRQIHRFIEVDLWRLKLRSLPKKKKFLFYFLKIIIISVKEYIRDRCTEKASALTYLSALSLVPVIAMAIAIAKAFGLRQVMEEELQKYFNGQDQMLENILPAVDNMLSTDGDGIATIVAVVVLIYTVVKLLMNIESAFNDMWDIKQSRRWERKISDYIAIILLGPVLLIVASSATVFVRETMQDFLTNWELLSHVKSGIFFLLQLLPYTIIWLLLFGIYLIFPNTQVKVFPALISGIIAGTLYQVNQQAFISFQFAFARINAIYGSIAFLPLFLIWLQISWMIVLLGTEICYAIQYSSQWEIKSEELKISNNHRKKLSLLLLYKIIKKFEKQTGGMPLNELSENINVPRRYISEICHDLEKAKLISRIASDELAYHPAFDINQMDIHTVLNKLEDQGMGDFDSKKSRTFTEIESTLKAIENTWKESQHNILIKDL